MVDWILVIILLGGRPDGEDIRKEVPQPTKQACLMRAHRFTAMQYENHVVYCEARGTET